MAGLARRKCVPKLACGRITQGGLLALVWLGAGDARLDCTDSGLTALRCRAGASIITDRVIRFRRIRADTRGRIAGSSYVALVRRRTHGVRSTTAIAVEACLTRTACVIIIAGDPVLFRGLFTEARGVVAHTRFQTIAGLGAAYGGRSGADPCLTSLTVGAQASVIADCVVRLGRVAAEAGLHVAHTHLMAVV